MALVIPPGYAQASYLFGLAGDPEPMMTTVGIDLANITVSHDDYVEALADGWAGSWSAVGYANAWSFQGVTLRVGQDGGPPAIYEAVRSIPGTAAIHPLPNNCAILIRKQTALGGRAGRGRFYWPPAWVAEVDVDPTGVIAPTTIANLQTAFDAWFGGAEWVLLHDNVGPVIAPTPITSFVVQRQIATQRRRMRS